MPPPILQRVRGEGQAQCCIERLRQSLKLCLLGARPGLIRSKGQRRISSFQIPIVPPGGGFAVALEGSVWFSVNVVSNTNSIEGYRVKNRPPTSDPQPPGSRPQRSHLIRCNLHLDRNTEPFQHHRRHLCAPLQSVPPSQSAHHCSKV